MFVLLGFKEIDNSLVGVEFVHQFDFIFGELKIEYIHVLSDTRVGHRLGNRHHTDIELQNKKKENRNSKYEWLLIAFDDWNGSMRFLNEAGICRSRALCYCNESLAAPIHAIQPKAMNENEKKTNDIQDATKANKKKSREMSTQCYPSFYFSSLQHKMLSLRSGWGYPQFVHNNTHRHQHPHARTAVQSPNRRRTQTRTPVYTYQIAENHLGSSFIIFVSNLFDSIVIQEWWFLFCRIGTTQRTIGCQNDITFLAELYEFLLIDLRRHFDLLVVYFGGANK